MTVVVLGLDALDPEFLDEAEHPNLTLDAYREIETITSTETDRPSTHELWPTIVTGLPPEKHGIQLASGIEWENPIIDAGSTVSNYLLPKPVQVKLGAWLLDNTDEGAFRLPATYFEENGIATVFDGVDAKPIGIPNYVVDPDEGDREHELRKNLGELFQLDVNDESDHRHVSSDPWEFYELCLEMSMIRIARTRRALRSRNYELVFGYTSGLDLVGHVAYADQTLQDRAYGELNEFVGELKADLRPDDELVLVSDHGLQDGEHTNVAVLASTDPALLEGTESVLDVRGAIEDLLANGTHAVEDAEQSMRIGEGERGREVQEHLEDLGYM